MPYTLQNSTFLDAFGADLYTDAQYQQLVNGSIYGLNTWGWEDTFGGGDQDFNDLVVQLDFTSAHGHGWLA